MTHKKSIFLLFILAFTCTLPMSACTSGTSSKNSTSSDVAQPVPVSKALFHNPDSIAYYAELAYRYEDPKGLYVMGVAARLRAAGTLPDSITTVPMDEADIMLLRSAELGYPDAIKAIKCLAEHGCWNHSIPENK